MKTEPQELPDDLNPEYLFSLTHSKLLCKIATGEINAKHLARKQLADRGLDLEGKWIGFDAAAFGIKVGK